MTTAHLGLRGEDVAVEYLKKKRYRVLVRNWSVRGRNRKLMGELDVVAKKGKDIVFVEVKAGSSNEPAWRPEIHVTPTKAHRLKRAAQAWLSMNNKLDSPWQIDVISVDLSGEIPRVRHIPQAVSF